MFCHTPGDSISGHGNTLHLRNFNILANVPEADGQDVFNSSVDTSQAAERREADMREILSSLQRLWKATLDAREWQENLFHETVLMTPAVLMDKLRESEERVRSLEQQRDGYKMDNGKVVAPVAKKPNNFRQLRYRLVKDADVKQAEALGYDGRLSRLKTGKTSLQAIKATVVRSKTLILYVDGDEKEVAAIRRDGADVAQLLGLTVGCSIQPDQFTVKIYGGDFTRKMFNGPSAENMSVWSKANNVRILRAQWNGNDLIWFLDTAVDALKLCLEGIVFVSGIPAKARPWDQREAPLFCYRCCEPDHFASQCPLRANNRYRCGHCASEKHSSKQCLLEPGCVIPPGCDVPPIKCFNCKGDHKVWADVCENPAARVMHLRCQFYRVNRPSWAKALPSPGPQPKILPKSQMKNKKARMYGLQAAEKPVEQTSAVIVATPVIRAETSGVMVASPPTVAAVVSAIPITNTEVVTDSVTTADEHRTGPTTSYMNKRRAPTTADNTPSVTPANTPRRPKNKKQNVGQSSDSTQHTVIPDQDDTEEPTPATSPSTSTESGVSMLANDALPDQNTEESNMKKGDLEKYLPWLTSTRSTRATRPKTNRQNQPRDRLEVGNAQEQQSKKRGRRVGAQDSYQRVRRTKKQIMDDEHLASKGGKAAMKHKEPVKRTPSSSQDDVQAESSSCSGGSTHVQNQNDDVQVGSSSNRGSGQPIATSQTPITPTRRAELARDRRPSEGEMTIRKENGLQQDESAQAGLTSRSGGLALAIPQTPKTPRRSSGHKSDCDNSRTKSPRSGSQRGSRGSGLGRIRKETERVSPTPEYNLPQAKISDFFRKQ